MASKRRDFTEPLGTHGTEPEVEPLARSHSGASLLTTQLGGPSHPGEGGGGVSLKPSDPAAPMAADVVIDSQGSETAKFLQFLGPGILVAAVYVDPGQIVVDMESGSVFGFKLLWACVLANMTGIMFQHLCSRLSIVTGRNLAEENRLEYPAKVRIFLWLTVELASIAADIGYVMGTATALSILFGLELHWGVLVTGMDTFLALGLQSWGIRKVELLVGVLFTLIIGCYFVEITQIAPPPLEILDGLLPRLWHRNSRFGYATWLELLCANLGAASALVMTRQIDRTDKEIRSSFKHNLAETALCLGIATFINVVMLILAGTVFFPERVVSLDQCFFSASIFSSLCGAIGAKLLEKTLGSTARGAFAVAMLCAGQSSSLSGVLATQYIMEGFFQMTVPSWAIRLVTRIIAILPAFYIVFSYGPDSAAEMIEQAQVVVNLVVPFTVIPLTKFLSSELKMGQFRLSTRLRIACWIASFAAIILNLLTMCQTILEVQTISPVFKWAVLAASVALYAGMSLYLIRKEVVVGTNGVLPPVVKSPGRDKGFAWTLRKVQAKHVAAIAVLSCVVGVLIWQDALSPRYNSLVGGF